MSKFRPKKHQFPHAPMFDMMTMGNDCCDKWREARNKDAILADQIDLGEGEGYTFGYYLDAECLLLQINFCPFCGAEKGIGE